MSDSIFIVGKTNAVGGVQENGTAVADDVKMGKTIVIDGETVEGTLNLTNLIPENIKRGVVINGVVGIMDSIANTSALNSKLVKNSEVIIDLPTTSRYIMVRLIGAGGSGGSGGRGDRHYDYGEPYFPPNP